MSMPPVFVINLDKSTDRMVKISKRLSELGIAFERISAVYGADLSQEEIDKYYCPELNKKNYRRPLGLGEIGCYLSHIKVWEIIVERKIPCALILEDDIQFDNDFKPVVHHLSRYSKGFDVVKLYVKKLKPKIIASTPITEKQHLCALKKIPISTRAQLVSLCGSKKLIKNFSKFGRPIDVDMQYWWKADLKILSTVPSIASPTGGSASEIDKQGARRGSTYWLNSAKNIVRKIKYEFLLRTKHQDKSLPHVEKLVI